MKLLRRALYWHAAFWAGCGVGVIVLPHWALQTIFDQPPYPDFGYVRVCGAVSIGFALLMVLVAQKIEEVWWWSWAFVVTDAAIVTITVLQALFGSGPALLWWTFAIPNAALAAWLMAGIAQAGTEKPFA